MRQDLRVNTFSPFFFTTEDIWQTTNALINLMCVALNFYAIRLDVCFPYHLTVRNSRA